jgi:hypothetical protein
MRSYYKRAAESENGEGTAYIEFIDNSPTRQIEVYNDLWRWGDRGNPMYLADQDFSVMGLTSMDEISSEEFEAAWEKARKEPPHVNGGTFPS